MDAAPDSSWPITWPVCYPSDVDASRSVAIVAVLCVGVTPRLSESAQVELLAVALRAATGPLDAFQTWLPEQLRMGWHAGKRSIHRRAKHSTLR